ncbi:IS5 family transposase [Salininema proteolyticum]|uniref:IS5 family transposase n=1 Tax=Salininema proteolyticum TaxID=1607685 RepID=UPI003625CA75
MHPTCDPWLHTTRTSVYPSDCTDAEWALIAPLLPVPAALSGRGGHEHHCRRAIVDAIRYIADSGTKWRSLPVDFPPFKTVYGFYSRWVSAGVWDRINTVIREKLRYATGRKAEPSAVSIDSQSVKADMTVPAATRGYDGGKKINGRKRHIAVDTMGLILVVMVTGAGVQDRTAARDLLFALSQRFPTIARVWADSGYQSPIADLARELYGFVVEIVSKLAGQRGFVVQPRRWVVERSFAWLMHRRRLCRDYERKPEHAEGFVLVASIFVMARQLSKMES